MAEYTYKDIIMDPNDPRLEGAIGKECYVSDFPKNALDYARNNSTVDCLKSINKELSCPFVGEHKASWAVVIIKKEEPKSKPKYIPFENVTEFLDAYRNAPGCLNEEAFYLSKNGIWLKQKEPKAYVMVTEIWDVGVVIGDNKFIIDEESICNNTTDWSELLKDFTFLDNSPCGKVVEETNG